MPLLPSDCVPSAEPWLSSVDGAHHTRVQLMPWLLFPAPLTTSEDVLLVTVRFMKTNKYGINNVKEKEVLIEMEIFFFLILQKMPLRNVKECGNRTWKYFL